tara:strand:- start:167 stop:391 length:225 start_codon:yes stop_codon:yes gene_type:complete
MNSTLTLLPAYGRDYKSKKAFIKDIEANKDFLICNTSSYINKAQFKDFNISDFKIRYNNLTQVQVINIKRDLKK